MWSWIGCEEDVSDGEQGRGGRRDEQEEREKDPSSEEDKLKPFAMADDGGGAGERGAGTPAAVQGKERSERGREDAKERGKRTNLQFERPDLVLQPRPLDIGVVELLPERVWQTASQVALSSCASSLFYALKKSASAISDCELVV